MNKVNLIYKKCIAAMIVLLIAASGWVRASEPIKITSPADVQQYISSLYHLIKWPSKGALDEEIFTYGVKGFINLKNSGQVPPGRDILTIADYSKSANTYRLWIIDLKRRKVLFNNYVAHGQGSGEEFATKFSNINDSHQSSLGFFLTRGSYMGDNGYSLRLEGVDGNFNNQAMNRAIVMHGADYVCKGFIQSNNRLGRSWGCPAVAASLAVPIINAIKGGSVLFVYHPTKSYLSKSSWINRPISKLPDDRNEVLEQAKLLAAGKINLKIDAPEALDETLWLTDSTVIDSMETYILIRNYERKVPIKIITASAQ